MPEPSTSTEPPHHISAESLLLVLGVRDADDDFVAEWDRQIDAVYQTGTPQDTRLALLGAVRAVFPIFLPGKTGSANAKNNPRGSGAFLSSTPAPQVLSGWYTFIVDDDTVQLYDRGGVKYVPWEKPGDVEEKLIWEGKGEQYSLDGTWRVFFH